MIVQKNDLNFYAHIFYMYYFWIFGHFDSFGIVLCDILTWRVQPCSHCTAVARPNTRRALAPAKCINMQACIRPVIPTRFIVLIMKGLTLQRVRWVRGQRERHHDTDRYTIKPSWLLPVQHRLMKYWMEEPFRQPFKHFPLILEI